MRLPDRAHALEGPGLRGVTTRSAQRHVEHRLSLERQSGVIAAQPVGEQARQSRCQSSGFTDAMQHARYLADRVRELTTD